MTFACLFGTAAQAQITFKADAITGKVVDEETGEPLAGVIIVAQWTIDPHFVGYDNELLNVLESVSDKDGNYGFPAWGPKLLSVPAVFISASDLFGKGDDPMVVYYKSGYWPAKEYNEVTYSGQEIASRKTPLGGFAANGKTIRLKKWDGKDERKYYDSLRFMTDQLLQGGWKSFPRMTLAIDRIFQIIVQRQKRKEISPAFPSPHIIPIEYLSAEDQAYLKGFAE